MKGAAGLGIPAKGGRKIKGMPENGSQDMTATPGL